MKKTTFKSILFISYSFILALLFTLYPNQQIYTLNFYIFPILFAAYYYNIFGGVIMALLCSIIGIVSASRGGIPITAAPFITQIIIFGIVGTVAGLFQRENNRLNKYLLKASLTDMLTGLYNYGHFNERIKQEVSRSARYNRKLALIMIDIDHFKHYNDTFGHEKGNQVLIKLAQIFKNNIRQSDVAFRYGGEEFAIIIPETGESVNILAERLRKAVAEAEFTGKHDAANKATISLGVSFHPWSDDVPLNIVERADKALYQAKKSGRNRICIYGE